MKLNRKDFLLSSALLALPNLNKSSNAYLENKVFCQVAIKTNIVNSINRIYSREEVLKALEKKESINKLVTLTSVDETSNQVLLLDVVGEISSISLIHGVSSDTLMITGNYLETPKYDYMKGIGLENFVLRPVSTANVKIEDNIQKVYDLSFSHFNFTPIRLASKFN